MTNILKHRKIGVRCYDNGGDTADRYTVVYTGRYRHLMNGHLLYVGMSNHPFHPQGVGMHAQSLDYIDNRGYGQLGGYAHLGRRIDFDQLPPDCKKLVMSDCFDLALS